METKVKIGIVDEHIIFRNAIRTIISKNDQFELALEAENRLDFTLQLNKQVDVVLIDIEMLIKDQYNLIRQAKLRHKNVKIIALSLITEEHYFGQLINSGVSGIISKHTSRKVLVEAIEQVMQNKIYISDNYNKTLVDNSIKIGKMETKKVLLVDDDIDIITVAKAILTKEGFEVYTASNKIEGLKKAKEVMPDIAVLDVMMTTYFEGFELAKGFKDDEQLKRIPVVIQSSIDVLISSDYSVIDMAKNMRAQAQYKELDVLLIKDITTGKGGIDYRTNDNKSHWVEVEGFMKKPIESNILLNTINKILKNS
jgi:DNA-binding NarL/FixJ family response regulator